MHILPAAMFGFCMFSALLIVFSGRSAARYYLVGLLVNLSFGHLVHAADFFSNESPRIVMLVMNARVFLYGPLIYLFLVHSIKMRRKWHPGDVLHFFPAILSFVLLLFVSVQKNEQSRIFLFSLMLHAQILLMFIYGVRTYSQIRDYIPDPLAGKINRNCPGGQGLLVAIVMFFLLWMAQQLLMLYLEGDAGIYKHVRLIRGIIILSYTLTICYVAVRMFLTESRRKPIASIANNMQESSVSNGEMGHVTQLHNGVRNGLDGNGDQLNEHSHDSECERKYSRSGLKSDQIPVVLDRVVHYMETCRPYLDPEFAPRDMAAALDLPVAHISQVINQELQTNFYGLVNQYRVEAVINELLNDPNASVNLLHLALNSGFNSKSTFNSAFKRITGQTPSEFKADLTRDGSGSALPRHKCEPNRSYVQSSQ